MINAGPSLHIKLAQAAAPSLANPPHLIAPSGWRPKHRHTLCQL